MSSATRCGLILMVLNLCLAGAASADEVVLRNGDRITGKLVNLSGGVLTIDTPYAGKVKLDMSQVDTFSTEEPVFLTIGNSVVQAVVVAGETDTVMFESDELLSAEPVALSRISGVAREKAPAVKVSGRVNIGASSTSGNTETDKVNANVEVVARSAQNRFTIGAIVNKAKDKGTQTESNSLGYMKYDHFVSKRWYTFANMSGENDKFKDIKLRTTIGLGTGYQLRESELTNVSFELGVNYVSTDFEVAEDQDYPAGRWAFNFDRKLFGTATQLFHKHEVFGALDDSGNLFARTQTGLRMPILAGMNSTIQYNYDVDTKPATGRAREDHAWLFTLGYAW